MDRRTFLKSAIALSASNLLPGAHAWALSTEVNTNKKKLIVVMLRGAVDGLNVVVPYGDPSYYEIRKSIAVARPGSDLGAIALDRDFGLHPVLEGLMPMWKDKSLAFVTSSGSPDKTRSHFDAQDYMESGVPGMKAVSTGWMNRLVSLLPDNHSPVRALNLGPTIPRILSGPASVANASIGKGGNRPLVVDRPQVEQAFEEMYGSRGDALGKAFRDGIEARHTLSKDLALNEEMEMSGRGAPSPNEAPNFGKTLATLIVKDPKIQVAFLAFGGWDTHVNEGSGKGQLANKLTPLGNGLADLCNGLGDQYKDTTIVVMSEFGRTAHENGNGGTDHGHGNVMWLMGGAVRGGKVYGKYNGLASNDLYEGRDLPVSTDFRAVISSVLLGHMGLQSGQMEKIFPNFNTQYSDVANIINA
jgi:uncharacterized protein (DUF1501 family)